MSRYVWFLVLTMAVAACSSGRSEQRSANEPSPPPPAVPTPSAEAGVPPAAQGTAGERADQLKKDAEQAVSQTQARLDEATREQQVARSELDGSRQDLQRAQQQAAAAERSDDALARARAAEAIAAATERSRVAGAHAEYAQRLLAARAADVESARAHRMVVELQLAPSSDPSHAQRLAEATRAEEQARAHALELGQSALTSQRQWQALAQTSPGRGAVGAGSPTPSAAESGTATGAAQGTGAGAPSPSPAPAPAPAPDQVPTR